MAFTYAQLKTAIQDYTENTETSFVTNLPVFIRAAEDRIFKLVDLELFRKNATSALTQNDPYLSVPSDYLASFSLSITNSSSKEFLLQKDVNFLQEYRPASLTAGADGGTTWLSDNAPNALLYGSLYEAYIYMKGEQDMLQMYEKQFTEALSRIKDLAEARENSDAYRRGLPDRPRT